jgi:hypothetical protein
MRKDVEYIGELREITIRDLRNMSNLSEKELFDIARKSNKTNAEQNEWKWGDSYTDANEYNGNHYAYDDYRIEVMDFLFYTHDIRNYEAKKAKDGKGEYFNRKGFDYSGSDTERYRKKKVQKKIEMEYNGTYIPSVDKVVNYGRSKNILRPKKVGSISPRCIRRYIQFRLDGPSMVERMIPHLDTIQVLTLKIRQFIAEAAPPGLAIDINGIVETNLQIEGIDDPYDLIKLYKQKGIILYDGVDPVTGSPKNGKTVEFLPNGIQDQLVSFYNAIREEIQAIREETGINEARDATSPDAKALVGIQKLQLMNSNNSTREIYEAFRHIFQGTGEGIGRMIQDKIHFEGSIDQYESVIGELGVESLKKLEKDITMAVLGIVVEALPGEVELEQLNMDIGRALESGMIELEDSMEIRRQPNIKKAERMLIHRKKKKRERDMQEAQMKEQMIGQREQQTAMAAAEADRMKKEAEAQFKIQLAQAETEFKKQLQEQKAADDARIEHIKGKYELEKIRLAAELNLEGSKHAPAPKVMPDPDDTTSELTQ